MFNPFRIYREYKQMKETTIPELKREVALYRAQPMTPTRLYDAAVKKNEAYKKFLEQFPFHLSGTILYPRDYGELSTWGRTHLKVRAMTTEGGRIDDETKMFAKEISISDEEFLYMKRDQRRLEGMLSAYIHEAYSQLLEQFTKDIHINILRHIDKV